MSTLWAHFGSTWRNFGQKSTIKHQQPTTNSRHNNNSDDTNNTSTNTKQQQPPGGNLPTYIHKMYLTRVMYVGNLPPQKSIVEINPQTRTTNNPPPTTDTLPLFHSVAPSLSHDNRRGGFPRWFPPYDGVNPSHPVPLAFSQPVSPWPHPGLTLPHPFPIQDLQPFNPSTLQLFNPSLFNPSTLQLFKSCTFDT